MDAFIIIMAAAFLGIIGALVFFILKEPGGAAGAKENFFSKNQGPDPAVQMQKKVSGYEEKFKKMELDFEALALELSQTQAREKALLKEKSQSTFDAQEYEKFKKDFTVLKAELTAKEEAFEKEISEKRNVALELARIRQEAETLKKKIIEAEDASRKSQTTVEALTRELESARKTLADHKKIVQEHTENKVGGEWVSRQEFEKVEKELCEKEAMIQKILSLKKEG